MAQRILITIILLQLLQKILLVEVYPLKFCSERNYSSNLPKNAMFVWAEIFRGLFCVSTNNSGNTQLSGVDVMTAAEATDLSNSLLTELTAATTTTTTTTTYPYIYYTRTSGGTTEAFTLPIGNGNNRVLQKMPWRTSAYMVKSGQIYTTLNS